VLFQAVGVPSVENGLKILFFIFLFVVFIGFIFKFLSFVRFCLKVSGF